VKSIFAFVLCLSGLFFLTACGGDGGSAPVIKDTALHNGVVNLPFDFKFTVANGLQPFTWMETGPLPDGMVFSTQGELFGTPTKTGSFRITVNVKDSLGRSSTPLSVTIKIVLHGFQGTGDLVAERVAHTATLLTNGKVLIAGGLNNSVYLATAELFDPATGTFTATGMMTAARSSFTATLLAHGPAVTNGKVLVTGGYNGHELATAELFDPATGTFTATGAMIEPRYQHTATLLNNGNVLLAGGTGDNSAELFDPATGSFVSTGGMLLGERFAPTATLLTDGTVLIAGGYNYDDTLNLNTFAKAELFNPSTGIFTATGDMTSTRSEHAATLLNNEKVVMTGGGSAFGDVLATADLFDPTTGTFSPTPMASPHELHTATLLNDGTVLVAGGFLFPNPPGDGSAIAEVFDPTANHFTPTGSMGTARFLHTATLLNNGQVLITGGLLKSNPAMTLSSAELFN
jgi:hypothetical protein